MTREGAGGRRITANARAKGPRHLALTCPICGIAPMKERHAGRTTKTLRKCGACRAEFRAARAGAWRLEYLHPDWFHRAAALGPVTRSPLFQTHGWPEWPKALGAADAPPPRSAEGFGVPHGMAPQESVRCVFGPARLVVPQTHTPQHSSGPTGAVWVTDRALRIEVGDFRWAVPLREITSVRDVGGLVEVTSGPTGEPLHLLVPHSPDLAREIGRAKEEEHR